MKKENLKRINEIDKNLRVLEEICFLKPNSILVALVGKDSNKTSYELDLTEKNTRLGSYISLETYNSIVTLYKAFHSAIVDLLKKEIDDLNKELETL